MTGTVREREQEREGKTEQAPNAAAESERNKFTVITGVSGETQGTNGCGDEPAPALRQAEPAPECGLGLGLGLALRLKL